MFIKAKPVWLRGLECEQNCFASFQATVPDLRGVELHLTAATFYRLFVNGKFVAFGPARTATGYARMEKIDLSAYHRDGENTLVIEVAGYYCRSFASVKQPSYLCCELCRGDEVIAYTGRDFIGRRMWEKLQAVDRYSKQRHFSEVWDENATGPSPETVVLPLSIKVIDRVHSAKAL